MYCCLKIGPEIPVFTPDNGLDPNNQFQSSVAFHIETSHLIWTTNHMTGFYMKHNTGLKRVNWFSNSSPVNMLNAESSLIVQKNSNKTHLMYVSPSQK